ncbi:CCA tRNA nucleotidyltransferase, mitochondrial [Cyberlindnera fabianii]|uniref:CCA tRNA nucleotidyltransferase, mitochondrial n=1 Tax=Cyberlindnera fabianii TaxID=36022 RepID=A0A1V2L1P3_CYBFA|nr:CCA tRNA nucleotidyltransferase, mitochondrial [Cyberlindnera fabianii]
MVTKISSTSGDFQAVVNKLPEFKRSEIGFVLRNYDAEYKLALVFNLFDEVIKNENDKMDGILSKYEQMWDLIHAERLEDVYKLKPLVDGKKVCKVLDRKPGPWMAPLTNQILVWQLDNPDKSEEECLQFIKGVLEK